MKHGKRPTRTQKELLLLIAGAVIAIILLWEFYPDFSAWMKFLLLACL